MPNGDRGSREQPSQDRPIFVLGILPRSGTAFLSDLLCAHPDCARPLQIQEDFFVHYADLLGRYVDAVYERWNPSWRADPTTRDRLYARIGTGLTSFLTDETYNRRLVTKTPRVDNLHYFFKLFPDAYLLILIRDGRAILESGIKSFGWNRESALHRLTSAAQTILDFDKANRESTFKYMIVRYEDLWQKLDHELRRVFDFVGLDPAVYDFESAARLPVRGSSTVRKHGDDPMHWKPLERAPDFDPMSRWRDWTRARHERFNRVAGRYFAQFGYEEKQFGSFRILWAAWNLLQDAKWLAIRTLGPSYLRLKNCRAKRKSRAEARSGRA